MQKRYALRMETADGTLEDAYHYMSVKREAISAARLHAKNSACPDVIRYHVDDTTTDMSVASFETRVA